MVFVSLGSQKFQFDRLLVAIDKLELDEEVFAQIGYSKYKPIGYSYKDFVDRNEYNQIIDKADIVITHGGTGAIVNALKKKKKVIAVPRLSKYGEHVDDHQLQIVKTFQDLGYIYACEDMDLVKAINTVRSREYNLYENNTDKFIRDLEEYICFLIQ